MIINIIFQNSFSGIFYKYFVNKFCDRYFRNRDPSHKKITRNYINSIYSTIKMVLMVNSYISILLLLFALFLYICVSFAGTRDGANFLIFDSISILFSIFIILCKIYTLDIFIYN